MKKIEASKLRTWGFPQRLIDGAAVDVRRTHTASANPYKYGYGFKIPTQYFVLLKDGRWRRVYRADYGHVTRFWVMVCGDDCTLDSDTEAAIYALHNSDRDIAAVADLIGGAV